MNLNINNKNALICGSTSGIGKASAMELASQGANITLVARNEDKLNQVLSELPSEDGLARVRAGGVWGGRCV